MQFLPSFLPSFRLCFLRGARRAPPLNRPSPLPLSSPFRTKAGAPDLEFSLEEGESGSEDSDEVMLQAPGRGWVASHLGRGPR